MEIGMKERLIGAVVLVVLGIIIIPFFLKGSSPDNGASQSVTLPPSDSTAPQQQYTLALSPATAAAGTVLAPSTATSQPVLNPARAQKPVVHDIPRKPVSAAAQAPAPQGKWVVQAGSYGSEANAGKVVSTLSQQGFHAYISRFSKGGHTFYRVRVGPYADRAAADKAVAAVGQAYHGKAEVVPNS